MTQQRTIILLLCTIGIAITAYLLLPRKTVPESFPDISLSENVQSYLTNLASATFVEADFSIAGKDLAFSATHKERYRIHQLTLSTQKITHWPRSNEQQDHFYPVKLPGEQLSIADTLGNQQFMLTREGNESIPLNGKARLFGSPSGEVALAIDSGRAQCLRAQKPCGSLRLRGRFRGHTFSPNEQYALVSTTEALYLWDLRHQRSRTVAPNIRGERGGPAFAWDQRFIYFSAVHNHEFKEIYRLSFTTNSSDQINSLGAPELFHQSNHDKNQLVTHQGSLYFIENVRTSYLLRRLNIKTKTVESLTETGVVYRYHVTSSRDQIIASYADATTPLAIVTINGTTKERRTLFPKRAHTYHMGRAQIEQPRGLSPAWVFRPQGEPKGVVVTVHGGPQICVSPRWEATVQLWLEMGLTVIAPNYIGSRCYGVSHMHRSARESVLDLLSWVGRARLDHQKLPLFVDGLSHGGELVQEVVAQMPDSIDGLIVRSAKLLLPLAYVAKLPPTLIQYSQHDALVPVADIDAKVKPWSKALPGKIHFKKFDDEGHLIRGPQNVSASLESIAKFMESVLHAH